MGTTPEATADTGRTAQATFVSVITTDLGQWYDQNFGQWNQIGASGVQSPFVGDGSLHDMKNAWSYEYLASNDTGYWATGGKFRLAYGYTGGVWFDNSDTWRALSATGVGSAFIGNAAIGAYYSLNNNWYYGYDVNQSIGYWKAGTGQFRFAYYYPGGIWYDAANTGGWATLGSAGLSSAFLGDGSLHDMKNSWSYYYVFSQDIGYWRYGSDWRYGLAYGVGQWYLSGYGGDWNVLGTAGRSSSFMGDTAYHYLGNYEGQYLCITKGLPIMGTGSTDGTESGARYGYNWGDGHWGMRGCDGVWNYPLGSTGFGSNFMGDGNYHYIGIYSGKTS